MIGIKSILLISALLLPSNSFGQSVKVPRSKIKDSAHRPTYYVLSIGIDRYKDDFWPDLKWTVKDAARVADKMGKDTGYQRKVIRLSGAQATTEAIKKALSRLSEAARETDIVLVYLSGHGTLAADDEGRLSRIFVAHNTDPTALTKTGIPHSYMRSWLENLSARRKLVVYATCHGGVGKSRLPPRVAKLLEGTKGPGNNLAEVSEGSLILSASAKNEIAREDDKLESDIYTHFLLEALTTYDRDQDGMVTAAEAHDYAKEKTYRYTKGRQRPTSDAQLIGSVEIPMSGKKSGVANPIIQAYDKDLDGFELAVADGAKGTLPLAFPLQKGKNVIMLFGPGGDKLLAKYRISASKGEVINIDDLLSPPPFYADLGLAVDFYQDKTYERLSGGSVATYGEPEIGLQWHELSLGLQASQQRLANDLSDLIEATGTITTYQFNFHYRYRLGRRFSLGPVLGIGQSEARITLKDKISEDAEALRLDASSLYYHGGLRAILAFSYGIRLQTQFLYRNSQLEFDRAGNLDGSRLGFSLGIGWEGFGKGVRL